MQRVVEVEAIKKSPELTRAVAAELDRVNNIVAQRQRDIVAGISDPSAPSLGPYLGLLVQACAQSDSPAVIEPLVGAIETGNTATRALARFGPAALNQVLALAEGDISAMQMVGVLRTLGQMQQLGKLLPGDELRVSDTVRQVLYTQRPFVVLREAIDLAVTSSQTDLRERVAAIASGNVVPDIVDHKELTAELRRAAQSALSRRPR